MGSYNVSCSVSNLTIKAGDDIALFILKADTEYPSEKNKRLENTAGYIYPDALFSPYLLPIFGKYDDYGSIDNIIKNTNTQLIEKKFETPILKLMEKTVDDNPFNLSFMFVHKDIYDLAMRNGLSGQDDNLSENYRIKDFFLKKLGFEFDSKDGEDHVYILKNKWDGSIMKTILSPYDSAKINDKIVYNMKDFFKVWEEEYGHSMNFNLLSEIDFFYEEILNRLSFEKSDDIAKNIILKSEGKRDLQRFISPSIYNSVLFDFYEDNISIENKELIHSIADFVRFSWFMKETNNIFIPSIGGAEFDKLDLLYKQALITKNDKKAWNEDILDYYLETKNLENTKRYLLEILEEDISLWKAKSGLSLFEMKAFAKDNSVLEDILSGY